MELKISELNTNQENEDDNYWGNPKEKNTKRKKVSFDDILSNMNLVVNQQGVLQHMGLIAQEPYQQQPQHQQNYYQQQPQHQQNYYQPPQQHLNNASSSSPPSLVKHGYIYNKYFKDQYNEQPPPVIRVPKTMEEYKQMLLDDRIKAIQQKHRIDQIKSTKMMFISSPETINNPRNIQSTKNTLRSMNFH